MKYLPVVISVMAAGMADQATEKDADKTFTIKDVCVSGGKS